MRSVFLILLSFGKETNVCFASLLSSTLDALNRRGSYENLLRISEQERYNRETACKLGTLPLSFVCSNTTNKGMSLLDNRHAGQYEFSATATQALSQH